MISKSSVLEDMANAGLEQILKKEREKQYAQEFAALQNLNKWRQLEAELRQLLPFVLREHMQPLTKDYRGTPFRFGTPNFVTISAPELTSIRIHVALEAGRWQIAGEKPIMVNVAAGEGIWNPYQKAFGMSELVLALGTAKYHYQAIHGLLPSDLPEPVYEDLDEEIPEQMGC